MRAMKAQYGSKEGEKVFYASKNKGTIKGVKEETQMNWQNKLYESLLENNMSDDGKRESVGTRKGQQRGLRPLGGKSKVTRDYINKAGERVFVTTLPSGETRTTTVKKK